MNNFNAYLDTFKNRIALRGLTSNTLKNYCTYIRTYLEFLSNLSVLPEQATYSDMRSFVQTIQAERHLSDRTINCIIAQLRFFTIYVIHKAWDATQLPTRKFDTYLPYVPSQQETIRFIETISNLKFKAIVILMYSCGLRVSEACNLKYEDISRKNMSLHVVRSKNRSDRYVPLAQYALNILTQYWYAYGRPRDWLFPQSPNKPKPIYTQWVGVQIRKHEKLLGWKKQITCHTFRHAIGTHLYENGADLLTVKAFLGHKSINSTVIYINVANPALRSIKNPIDILMGKSHA